MRSAPGAAIALAFVACGGSSFVFVPPTDDGGIGDATADNQGPDDAGPRDGSPRDATADARGIHDATQGDALTLDAGTDVVEEPPTHCGGGFACAPPVPSGWKGPFELYAGAGTRPACDPGFSGTLVDGYVGLSAPPATCGCACGASTGVQCASPAINFYASSTTCSLSQACAAVMLIPGACTRVDVSSACGTALGVAMSLPQSTASLGSCAPVPTVSVPPLSWSTSARGCGAAQPPAQADCASGSVCVPAPSAAFKTAVCIEQAGNVAACPSVDGALGYTSRFLYFTGANDTRGCSSCACGGVTGASCSGTVTQFQSSDGGCANSQIIYPLGQSCDPVQQPADIELAVTASGGSCAPGSTAPTGPATASTPITFGCTPYPE